MLKLNFKPSVSKEVHSFVSNCQTEGVLLKKLDHFSSFIPRITQHLIISKDTKQLAAKLLYRIDPKDLSSNTVIKDIRNIETMLRNKGILNHTFYPNMSLKNIKDNSIIITAHKSILCLESSHLNSLKSGLDFSKHEIEVDTQFISEKVYQMIVKYLYLSDDQRIHFISTMDISFLQEVLSLAVDWGLDKLRHKCEYEIIKRLDKFSINTENELTNLIKFANTCASPTLASMLTFVSRVSRGGYSSTIREMNDPKPASQLALLCTKEEKKAFSTLKTELGKYCQLLFNGSWILGPVEWEQHCNIIIDDVPPIPEDFIERLGQPCPFFVQDKKKVSETHILFLVPKSTSLKKMQESKNQNDAYPCYLIDDYARKQYNDEAEHSYWVLMTTDVVPGSLGKWREEALNLVSKAHQGYEAPLLLDIAICDLSLRLGTNRHLFYNEAHKYTYSKENPIDHRSLAIGGVNQEAIAIYGMTLRGEQLGIMAKVQFF